MAQRTGIKAGRAFVSIDAIDKITPVLKRIWRNLGMFATQLRSVGRQMAFVGAAVGVAFVSALGRMTMAASDFQESLNFFEQVFGKQTDDMKAWSFAFAENIGRSKLQIIELMARSKAMFDQFRVGEEDAAELSKALTQLAIDYASLRNLTDEAAFEKIQAAVQGRPVGLSLSGGVTILQEVVKEFAQVEFGIDINDVDFATKALLRMLIAHRELSEAHGDAIRTSRFLANTMKRLGAAWVDAKVFITAQLLPASVALGESFLVLAKGGIEFLKNHIIELSLVVVGASVGFAVMGAAMWASGTTILTMMGLLKVAMWAWNAAVMASQIVMAAWGGIMQLAMLGPVGLAVLLIGGIIAALIDWGSVMSNISNFITTTFAPNVLGVFGAVKGAFSGIVDAVKAGDLELAWEIGWLAMKIVYKEFIDGFRTAWTSFTNFLTDSWDTTIMGMMDLGVWEAEILNMLGLLNDVDLKRGRNKRDQLRKDIENKDKRDVSGNKRRQEIKDLQDELDGLQKKAREMDPLDLTDVEGMDEINAQMEKYQALLEKLIREGAARGVQGGGGAGDRPEFLQRGSEAAFQKIMEIRSDKEDDVLAVNKDQLISLEELVEQGRAGELGIDVANAELA